MAWLATIYSTKLCLAPRITGTQLQLTRIDFLKWQYAYLSALICLCLGCGAADSVTIAPVDGKVMFEGAPVTEGVVTFEDPVKGFAASGLIQPDGTFKLRSDRGNGIPTGNYKVTVNPPSTGQPRPDQPAPKRDFPNIPEKYRNAKTSGLLKRVLDGENSFELKLEP